MTPRHHGADSMMLEDMTETELEELHTVLVQHYRDAAPIIDPIVKKVHPELTSDDLLVYWLGLLDLAEEIL